MLLIIGLVLLIGGAFAVILGHIAYGDAVKPGWAAVILGVVFLLVGYVFPNAGHDLTHRGDPPPAASSTA